MFSATAMHWFRKSPIDMQSVLHSAMLKKDSAEFKQYWDQVCAGGFINTLNKYIYICVCIYVYSYVYVNMCMYICVYISLCVYVYVYIHICIHVFECMHIQLCFRKTIPSSNRTGISCARVDLYIRDTYICVCIYAYVHMHI